MYRIVAVIVLSFIYSVQSEPATSKHVITCNVTTSALNESRLELYNCFKSIVEAHVNGTTSGKCRNVSEFGISLQSYYAKVTKECKLNFTYNTDNFLKFVNFSLHNETFKEFYKDIACVISKESNISQCVSDKVGHFKISNKKKHSMWHEKIVLYYNGSNCANARDTQDCTLKVLDTCKNTTRQYIASLFEFSLKNCNDTSGNKTTNRPPKAEPSTMSTPVLATVITISVIIAIVVFVLLFIKLKHKMGCYNIKPQ